MDTRASTTWCVTQVCAGSADEVAARLAAYGQRDGRFVAAGASLTLVPDPPDAHDTTVTRVAVERVHRARLRYAGWWPAANVTVEVEPWSVDRSAVTIRPGRRLPLAGDRYLGAALGLARAIAAEVAVEAPAAAPGRPHPVPLRRAS